jgi:hypothetical protein
MRRRYFIVVSIVYLLLGGVIIARSVASHVVPIALLGLVFVALGAVRLRDYYFGGRTK